MHIYIYIYYVYAVFTSKLFCVFLQAYGTDRGSCDHTTIDDMMDIWTKQTVHPLLTISQSSTNILTITQERFFIVPHKDNDIIPPSPYKCVRIFVRLKQIC